MDLPRIAAIVTGASRGIGLAVAEALVARGARVAGLARDGARLDAIAQRLGVAFHALPCDVGDREAVQRSFAEAARLLGGLDVLVNCAGVGRFGAVDALDGKDWDELVATNLSGTHHCIRAAVPAMKAAGRGHIVNLASIAGLVGYPGASGYNATKFAVRGLTDALAKELAPAGIKVTAIFPGSTDTGFGQGPPVNASVMGAADVAAAVVHVLERPDHVLVGEMVLRPFP